MNSLMNSLRPYWERTRALFLDLVRRIEESALFERVVTEYESLEVRQQKWIQASLALVILMLLVLVITMPFVGLVGSKNKLDRSRRLVGEMRTFQDQASIIRRPAPRPAGVQNLPVGNPNETEESIKNFLASIGLGGDESQVAPNGQGGWKINIKELSLRQALALTFQVDGWYPAVRSEHVAMRVNPENKELLAMDMELRYAGGAPNFGPSAGPAPGSPLDMPMDGGGDFGGGDGMNGMPSMPPRGGANSGGENFGGYPTMPPPPPGMNPGAVPPDDFDSDLPPPSFPEEDM